MQLITQHGLCALFLPVVSGFAVVSHAPAQAPAHVQTRTHPQAAAQRSRVLLRSTAPGNDGDQPESSDGLILGGLDDEMGKMKSTYGFTESDFLAAARKRSEERKASVESGAKDDDWHQLADEKKELYGEMDDWESSKKEAGNADSQVLMFTDEAAGENQDNDGDDDDEPKLLLF